MIASWYWSPRLKDEDVISEEEREFLNRKIEELRKKIKITRPIDLRISSKCPGGEACAIGGALSFYRPIVCIHPDVISNPEELLEDTSFSAKIFWDIPEEENTSQPASEEAQEFILAHELSHIRSNDWLWPIMAFSILSFSLGIFSSFHFDNLINELGWSVVLILSCIFVLCWREKAADLRAASVCSEKVTRDYIAHLSRQIDENKEMRRLASGNAIADRWTRICITRAGNYLGDIFHFPLTEKVRYLQEYLERAQKSQETSAITS